MEIIIYTHEFPPFLGGLATTSYKLAQGISRAGYKVKVLAPNYPGLESSPYEDSEFQIIRMNRLTQNHGVFTPLKEIIGFYHLKKLLSENKTDVLILVTREAHFAGGLLKEYPDKVIARVAGYEAYRYLLGRKFLNRIIGKIMKWLYLSCEKVICPSEATRKLMTRAGIHESKTVVIYNGVDPKFITSAPDAGMISKLKNDLLISDNEKIVLTVSRLVPGKGQDQTIRALYEVNKQFGNFKYVLVGDGFYEANLRQLADKLGLKNKIIFAGPVSHNHVINYFDLCDIFVLANRTIESKENIEGLPNVVLEALARGKPVISGIPGGAKEVVENDITGYIVDGNDIKEMADKLLKLLENTDIARDFGSKAKDIIYEGYTEERMIEQYVALLQD